MKLARRKNYDSKKIIYPYIKISDFLKIPQIQEIIDNDNKKFYNFLKEISKNKYNLSLNRSTFLDFEAESMKLGKDKKSLRFTNHKKNLDY